MTQEKHTAFLAAHPGWAPDGEGVMRTPDFADFAEAMGFVTRVALAAQAAIITPTSKCAGIGSS